MCGKGGIELQTTEVDPYCEYCGSGNFLLSQFHSHFLSNDFAFRQFSTSFEMFTVCGELPKCKVTWQKKAVELTLLGYFFSLENLNFFQGSTLKNFHGVFVPP